MNIIRTDTVIRETTLRLRWTDRLRVLAGRAIHVRTRGVVDAIEGEEGLRVQPVECVAYVEPIIPRRAERYAVAQ